MSALLMSSAHPRPLGTLYCLFWLCIHLVSNVFDIKIFLEFFGDSKFSFILFLGLGLVGTGPDYKVMYLCFFLGRIPLCLVSIVLVGWVCFESSVLDHMA